MNVPLRDGYTLAIIFQGFAWGFICATIVGVISTPFAIGASIVAAFTALVARSIELQKAPNALTDYPE